eukprot:scaffold4176_cov109-Skeletonema_dohrnii-CCMP3373.AAC.6
MSGQSSFNNNNYHDNNNNNNGPRRVYVHHINEDHINPMGYPPQQQQYAPQPQPMFIPVPMPIPQQQPMPMSMFMGGMGGGMGYGFHQPQQPPVIIINGSGDQKPDNGGGESSSDDKEESFSSSTSPFHPVSLVSVIFFVIASILGFICVAKIYDVFESSLHQNYENEEEKDLDEHILDYLVVHRTVALGMGAASILMFMLAFDEEARIYPEVALTAVIGNMAAWICMFGYSQLARR